MLKSYFSEDIGPRMIDMTPFYPDSTLNHLTNPLVDFERQGEVEAWSDEYQRHEINWIAIDDFAAGSEPDCPHLLLTSAATGFGLVDQQSQRHMISARLS